jgi:hypothetical protein
MAAPALGWVQIKSVDPPVSLTARLSDTRPNVDAGYGGWQEVTRPRRRPLSIWQGAPGLRVSLPILFDRFADEISVERQIAQLERLATATASDGQPPRISFVARGAAVPHQQATWVIDTLTWGDATMNANGNRTRQQVTIAMLEWIADVRVRENSPAKLQRAKLKREKTKQGASNKRVVAGHGRKTSTTHTLRAAADGTFGAGDDLLSIAARELGDADRWVEIAQLNGLRDPRSISVGQVLRLP